ncbi:universal stress protein [Streptomyces sp. cg36]|uniref:universal stress protein n=1 Tax=Streptomyces sp. cg36 TaxID=3238798 RepID=UPI0034E1E654
MQYATPIGAHTSTHTDEEKNMSQAVRRVVVGVDGTPGSLAALRQAACEARRHRAELRPIRVRRALESDAQGDLWPLDDELERALHSNACHDLEHDCTVTLSDDGTPVNPAVITGSDPGRTLSRLARRDGDLLVVGTSRHSALYRFFFGSTRKHCLKYASCPVLVVPHETAGQESTEAPAAPPSPGSCPPRIPSRPSHRA